MIVKGPRLLRRVQIAQRAKRRAQSKVLLFLSLDIAGSTAYKREVPIAKWKATFRDFFQLADAEMADGWEEAINAVRSLPKEKRLAILGPRGKVRLPNAVPRIWKTAGDEAIYVKRIFSNADIWLSMIAFKAQVKAMANFLEREAKRTEAELQDERITQFRAELSKTFGKRFTEAEIRKIETNLKLKLSAKGSAWIATFPDFNAERRFTLASIGTKKGASTAEYVGPSIDAGFRIAKYSDKNKLPVSIELARTLADIARNKLEDRHTFEFFFDEGESLKGLLKDSSRYPMIWIRIDQPDENNSRGKMELRNPISFSHLPDLISVCENIITDNTGRFITTADYNKIVRI